MMDRMELMNQIYRLSFMVDDIKLYLDTHPDDTEALACFGEYSKLRNQSLKEYAKYYGPLTADLAMESCEEHWNWVSNPWPWQEGGC